ncbi:MULTISPECIES: DUF6311 domain-containing protein [unclassified Sphingomonas]|uniref:DUF6311 domain-containing protein n=1 Tax=unclassified Sphingomonas TaxID=196159 RepID=UPI00226A2EE5|nr:MULTISPECIES: DUF6311 domain-containing protein [unclassified Sphingomonas]
MERLIMTPAADIDRSRFDTGARPVPSQLRRRGTVEMRHRLITAALLLLLPLSLFCAFFHPATLLIDNAGWLIRGTDNGENALGAHAYWHDPAAGASLKTGLLNAPDGVSVLYTDSNPLLTLIVKPFAGLLPNDAQFVGVFILLSLILQALFAWLLLRRYAPGRVALWGGVMMLAFPPTLANRFVHVNLMAHWTILAALCLFLDERRGERLRWWAPLIAITALIHSYLLIMVGAIWASTMMARFTRCRGRARPMIVLEGLIVVGMVALLAWWLGVSDQEAAGNIGAFSMPLDALWNPALGHFTNLLPAHETVPNHDFEGFQYLGAGGLLLVATAIVIACRLPATAAEQDARHRLRQLAPALIVLGILAILPTHLPQTVRILLDPVRASGRMFWPVGYVLILGAVLAVFRLSASRAALALIGMIAVQTIDLTGMAGDIRAQSEQADKHQLFIQTLDPRWDKLIGQSRSVAFMPADVTRNLAVFQEVAWRAVNAGRPTSNVYAARTGRATIQRLRAERAAFDRGELVPGRLYVTAPGTPLPAAAAPYQLQLDGIAVVAVVDRPIAAVTIKAIDPPRASPL